MSASVALAITAIFFASIASGARQLQGTSVYGRAPPPGAGATVIVRIGVPIVMGVLALWPWARWWSLVAIVATMIGGRFVGGGAIAATRDRDTLPGRVDAALWLGTVTAAAAATGVFLLGI